MRASAIALIVGGACFAERGDDVARQELALDPPGGDPFLNTVFPSDPVGGTAGTFEVTDDGAATYTLPLWVPPGREGMQPDLSLSYHSGSGPSEVGLGWQIGGLSSIRRCRRDLTRDTGVRGVQFDAMDRFCLDGQRLVLVSGSYGAAGSEYRIERNGFAKITLGAASVFTVKSRDGRTTTYTPIEAWQGTGSAEHVWNPAALVNFAWVATRVEDRAGNFMTMTPLIQADPDFGAWRLGIQEIRYTGHASLGAGQRTVTFVYDTAERPDETIAFAAGVGVRAHRLLKRIEMRAPGEPELLRVYELSHAVSRSTGRSLLASIKECDGFGVCLEPIAFEYGDDQAVYDGLDPRSIEIVTSIPTEEGWLDGTTSDYSVFGLGVSHQPVTPMDFNGDGHDDLVIGRQSEGLNTWIAHPNLGLGGGFPAFGPGISLGLFHSTPVTLGVFDHDHDGDDALIAVNPDTFRARLLDLHTGGVTVVDPDLGLCGDRNQRIVTGDVDFNGSDDIVANCLEGTESHSYKLRRHAGGGYGVFPATAEEFRHISGPLGMPHVTSDAMFRVLIDHRGDGSREWLYHDTETTPANWRWDASSSAAGTFDSTLPRVTSGPSIAFLDANGDGLEDVLDTATMHLLVNIGRGFVDAGPAIIPGTGPDVSAHLAPDERDLRVVNLNGDGRDDFVIAYFPTETVPAKLVAYVSEGMYFRASSLLTPGRDIPLFVGRNSWTPFQPLDLDEDSIADFVYIHGTTDHLAIRHNLRDVPDLLTEVNDWRGRSTASYAPLTDEAVHTPLAGCAYPLRCTTDPSVRIVHRHETPDGGLYTHTYEGARSHVRGEGWLGFDQHRVVQEATGSIEITEFATDLTSATQPVRYYGAHLPRRRATMAPLGGGVHHGWVVDYTWTYLPLEGSTTHHAVVMTDRYDRELEIGGWNGTEIPPTGSASRTIHTTIQHDSFGNVEHEEQTHASATATSALRILHFSMTNDPVTWTIGRVDTLVETDFDDTLTSHVNRRTHYGYDPRGILNRTTRQPSSADEQETRYTLNAFGQATAMTEEDAGGVARTTTLSYDAESIFPRRAWNALDHLTTTYIHPGLGAPVLVVDPNGVERRARYDGFGRLRSSGRTGSLGASFRYEPRPSFLPGLQVHVVGGDGSERFSEYSRLGLLEVNRSLGFDGRYAREEFRYDPRLRMTHYRAPAFPGEPVTSTTYTYDNLDRVTAVSFADGTSYTTQYPPNEVRLTHPNGRVSEARFDARGRITSSVERNLGTGFRDTRYWYAPFDQVARVVRGTSSVSTLATWTFGWDVHGRLISTKEADDEVGVTYFGQRYLFQHLGRWTTPDPLHVHAVGGGEALNSYHYVKGNLLQARDPVGLHGFGTTSWPSPQEQAGQGAANDASTGSNNTRGPSQSPRQAPSSGAAEPAPNGSADDAAGPDDWARLYAEIDQAGWDAIALVGCGGLCGSAILSGAEGAEQGTAVSSAVEGANEWAAGWNDSLTPSAVVLGSTGLALQVTGVLEPSLAESAREWTGESVDTESPRYAHGSLSGVAFTAVVGHSAVAAMSAEVAAAEAASVLRFSQTTASPFFSAEGTFAGRTIGGVAAELRAGSMVASDVPVGFVRIGGFRLIVNTRSALSLTRAGIPRSAWSLIDMTATEAAAIELRLMANGLSVEGTFSLRITGMGRTASSLQ